MNKTMEDALNKQINELRINNKLKIQLEGDLKDYQKKLEAKELLYKDLEVKLDKKLVIINDLKSCGVDINIEKYQYFRGDDYTKQEMSMINK